MRTALVDRDFRLRAIEHLNRYHSEDILMVSLAHSDKKIRASNVADVYEEGILIDIFTDDSENPESLFVEFELEDVSLHDRIVHLVQTSRGVL